MTAKEIFFARARAQREKREEEMRAYRVSSKEKSPPKPRAKTPDRILPVESVPEGYINFHHNGGACGLTYCAISRAIERGRIQAKKIGRLRYVLVEDVERYKLEVASNKAMKARRAQEANAQKGMKRKEAVREVKEKPTIPEGYLTTNEIHKRYGFNCSSIHDSVRRSGKIDHLRVGRFVYISIKSFLEYKDSVSDFGSYMKSRLDRGTEPDENGYCTIRQLAKRYKCDRSSISTACRKGLCSHKRVGQRVLVKPEDWEAYKKHAKEIRVKAANRILEESKEKRMKGYNEWRAKSKQSA